MRLTYAAHEVEVHSGGAECYGRERDAADRVQSKVDSVVREDSSKRVAGLVLGESQAARQSRPTSRRRAGKDAKRDESEARIQEDK